MNRTKNFTISAFTKKPICILLSFILLLGITSCSMRKDLPDSITIEQRTYKRAFIGELYPTEEEFPGPEVIDISGISYYKYIATPFDCYIAYDINAEPNLYFSSEEYDSALQYYSNTRNFAYFFLTGNIHDDNESDIYSIQNVDSDMFDQLIDFAEDNEHNPFSSFNNEEGLQRLPIADPDNWMADEIHFYKESKEGAFSTLKGYTFVLTENKLALLYQYDFSNDDSPQMLLRDIPTEISDYFCDLIEKIKS